MEHLCQMLEVFHVEHLCQTPEVFHVEHSSFSYLGSVRTGKAWELAYGSRKTPENLLVLSNGGTV